MSYVPENGAGERSRTVVSALARPHSAVEPHPREMVSTAGLSPATWSLGHSALCFELWGREVYQEGKLCQLIYRFAGSQIESFLNRYRNVMRPFFMRIAMIITYVDSLL